MLELVQGFLISEDLALVGICLGFYLILLSVYFKNKKTKKTAAKPKAAKKKRRR